MEKTFDIKKVDLFLFDLDGTLYLGNREIAGSFAMVRALRDKGKRVIFLTNNSSKSRSSYAKKLKAMGLECDEKDVYTAGGAAIEYIKERRLSKSVLLIGTDDYAAEVENSGIILTQNNADTVLLSYDVTLTYDKLVRCSHALANGAFYIATHPDKVCPSPDGDLPDIGSFIALLHTATGRMPDVICGKPYEPLARGIMSYTGTPKERIAMVGDRLYTDMRFAIDNGFYSLLVLTGETSQDDYDKSDIRVSAVLDNAAQILSLYD